MPTAHSRITGLAPGRFFHRTRAELGRLPRLTLLTSRGRRPRTNANRRCSAEHSCRWIKRLPCTAILVYCNAGAPSPLLVRDPPHATRLPLAFVHWRVSFVPQTVRVPADNADARASLPRLSPHRFSSNTSRRAVAGRAHVFAPRRAYPTWTFSLAVVATCAAVKTGFYYL